MTVSKTYITGDTAVCYEAETVDELFALVSRFETGDNNDGWITWDGGECPVPGDTRVQTLFRCETLDSFDDEVSCARDYDWQNDGGPYDIIAYRAAS